MDATQTATRNALTAPAAGLAAGPTAGRGASAQFATSIVGARWLAALLALALARGALYLFVIPPWQHPDEPTHFEHVRVIAETWQFPGPEYVSLPLRWEIAQSMLAHGFWRGIEQPALTDESLAQPASSPIGIHTFAQPRSYYIVAALWLWPWLGQPVEVQLYVVRLLAVLLNLAVVACAYHAARLVFPGQPALAVAAAGFVVFQPGLTDIMSAANNDALVNAVAALFFLVAAHAYCRGWAWWSVPLGLFALAGGLAAKTTGLVTAAAAPLCLLFYPWRPRSPWLALLALLLLAGLAAASVALVLSGSLDPLLQGWLAAFTRYTRTSIEPTLQALVSPERRSLYWPVTVVVFRSFWAVFGWRHVALSPNWYLLPGLGMAAAGAGLVAQAAAGLARQRGRARDDAARAGYLLFGAGAVALAWVVAVMRSQAVQGWLQYQSHGRYAFVAIVPFTLLMAAGLLGWLPESRRRRGLWLYLAAWAAFDALAFWGTLVPYYYSS